MVHLRAGVVLSKKGGALEKIVLPFKFGVGDITGRDALDFWTKKRKTTVKWTAGSSNWMS